MKILQILPELNVGGVETGTLDLSVALRREGHEVFVMSNGGVLLPRLEKAGVPHVKLPVHRKELLSIFRMAWRVRRFLRENGIDIVHARSRVPGWIAYLATRGTRVQFVTTAHGAYRRHFGSQVMGWGKKVIVPSTAIWRRMHDEFEVPAEDLRLIPRGIDLERFRGLQRDRIPNAGPVVVGMVGRITPLKGHATFLKALALARVKEPRITARIVGDAPAHRPGVKENLVEMVRGLGLEKAVAFESSQPEVEKVYAGLDILVMASEIPESFGRVLVEAQAAGIPVITAALGGVLDIVEDGRTGTLFPAGDVRALADAMCALVRDPQRARDMRRAAWEKAQREYTVAKMAFGTRKVYEEVLAPKNILVMKFGSLGDVLLVEPSLRALREKFPKARISVLVKSSYQEVLKNCPHVDALIDYDSEGLYRGPGMLLLGEHLRNLNFDLCVDLQNNWRSHLLGFFAGIPWRLGYERKGGKILLSAPVPETQEKIEPLSHQFRLLSRLDIKPYAEGGLRFYGKDGDAAWADSFLKEHGIRNGEPLAAVHIGGSVRWKSKQWGLDSFAALVNALPAKTGMRAVLVGGHNDALLAERLRPLLRQPYVDAIGQTSLSRLGALLQRCKVLVGADSAPLHIACAVRVPFVAIFGPTDPKRHAPSGPGVNGKVLFKNPPCGPCYRPVCPEGHHRCMKDIALNEVIEAVSALQASAPRRQEASVP